MGEYSQEKPSFKFIFQKKNEITRADIDLVMRVYETANKPSRANQQKKSSFGRPKHSQGPKYAAGRNPSHAKREASAHTTSHMTSEEQTVIQQLKDLGVQVFYKDQRGKFATMTWDQLGGYEQQKRDIEDTILMALKYPGRPAKG